MSEVWLFLAIGSLFLAIVLVGVFIDQTIAERHRAVRLLESQVTGAGGQAAPRVDLREEELKENFGSRVFVPIVSKAGRIARRVTPLDARDRITKKLLVAGSPAGWDAERVLAFKIIGAIAGFVASVTSISIVPLASHALPFSGFGRVPAGQGGLSTGMVLCMPANIIQRPSGYWMTFGW